MLNWDVSGGCSSAWLMGRTNPKSGLLTTRQSEITREEDRDQLSPIELHAQDLSSFKEARREGSRTGRIDGGVGDVGVVSCACLVWTVSLSRPKLY